MKVLLKIATVLSVILVVSCEHNESQKDSKDTPVTSNSYEAFKSEMAIPFEEGYIVEWDIYLHSEEELRAYYKLIHQQENNHLMRTLESETPVEARVKQKVSLTVEVDQGVDVIHSKEQALQLTYCIDAAGFGNDFNTVEQDMEDAAADWEAVAYVDFIYLSAENNNCNAQNNNVYFNVSPSPATGQTIATAFFPNDPRNQRRLLIMNPGPYNQTTSPNLTLRGVLRHELGHILGLRHEHIVPQGTLCTEADTTWRTVNQYDNTSVMHYPNCGAGTNNNWALALSLFDIQGASTLYPIPSGSVSISTVNTLSANITLPRVMNDDLVSDDDQYQVEIPVGNPITIPGFGMGYDLLNTLSLTLSQGLLNSFQSYQVGALYWDGVVSGKVDVDSNDRIQSMRVTRDSIVVRLPPDSELNTIQQDAVNDMSLYSLIQDATGTSFNLDNGSYFATYNSSADTISISRTDQQDFLEYFDKVNLSVDYLALSDDTDSGITNVELIVPVIF